MTSVSWGTIFVVIVNAIYHHVLPNLSRPDILFSVTVPEAFVAGAGRMLVFRYRAIVWSATAAALALSMLLPTSQPGSELEALPMLGVVAGHIVVAGSAWMWARRKARAHAIPPSAVRAASLVPRDTSLPGGALVAAGPLVILLATALLAYAYRDQPPDGAELSDSLGFLGVGVVYVAMMLMMGVSMARRSRQVAVDGPAAAAEQQFRRYNLLFPVVIAYAIAISLSAMTIGSIPAFAGILSGTGGFVWSAVGLLEIGGILWMARLGQGGQRAVAPAARQEVHGDATPDAAWLAGIWYVNPRDPAMWVENRVGIGYTLNLGNWRAWLLMIGLILAPVIAGRLLF
jgi:uncharacterized membrane protein